MSSYTWYSTNLKELLSNCSLIKLGMWHSATRCPIVIARKPNNLPWHYTIIHPRPMTLSVKFFTRCDSWFRKGTPDLSCGMFKPTITGTGRITDITPDVCSGMLEPAIIGTGWITNGTPDVCSGMLEPTFIGTGQITNGTPDVCCGAQYRYTHMHTHTNIQGGRSWPSRGPPCWDRKQKLSGIISHKYILTLCDLQMIE